MSSASAIGRFFNTVSTLATMSFFAIFFGVTEKFRHFLRKSFYGQIMARWPDDGRSISRNVANINKLVQDKIKLVFQNILQHSSFIFTCYNSEAKHKNCEMLEESMKFGTEILRKLENLKRLGATLNSV